MKTLLFTLEYPPFFGGVANYYKNVVKFWPDNNIIALAQSSKEDSAKSSNVIKKKLVTQFFWPRWFFSLYYLWLVIIKHSISHILVGHVLPLGIVTYFVSRITKTKYSVILHGMDFVQAQKYPRKKYITRVILSNSENIICGNSHTANLVKKFIETKHHEKIKIINPGIDYSVRAKNEIIENLKIEHNLAGKFMLLSIGRIVKRKGFDKTIEALPQILSQHPKVVYIILGKGPDEDYIQSKINDLDSSIQSKIIWLKNTPDDHKWAWLNLIDVFVMPSRKINGDFEGFGIVYLEANLFGKPVIAGRSGGIEDAVKNYYNGILVDPESPDDIAGAINELIMDRELRLKLGEQGRHMVIKKYNWETQARKLHSLLTN